MKLDCRQLAAELARCAARDDGAGAPRLALAALDGFSSYCRALGDHAATIKFTAADLSALADLLDGPSGFCACVAIGDLFGRDLPAASHQALGATVTSPAFVAAVARLLEHADWRLRLEQGRAEADPGRPAWLKVAPERIKVVRNTAFFLLSRWAVYPDYHPDAERPDAEALVAVPGALAAAARMAGGGSPIPQGEVLAVFRGLADGLGLDRPGPDGTFRFGALEAVGAAVAPAAAEMVDAARAVLRDALPGAPQRRALGAPGGCRLKGTDAYSALIALWFATRSDAGRDALLRRPLADGLGLVAAFLDRAAPGEGVEVALAIAVADSALRPEAWAQLPRRRLAAVGAVLTGPLLKLAAGRGAAAGGAGFDGPTHQTNAAACLMRLVNCEGNVGLYMGRTVVETPGSAAALAAALRAALGAPQRAQVTAVSLVAALVCATAGDYADTCITWQASAAAVGLASLLVRAAAVLKAASPPGSGGGNIKGASAAVAAVKIAYRGADAADRAAALRALLTCADEGDAEAAGVRDGFISSACAWLPELEADWKAAVAGAGAPAPAGESAAPDSGPARRARAGAPAGAPAEGPPAEPRSGGSKRCVVCGAEGGGGVKIRRCKACYSDEAQYCSQECQVRHWKEGHKAACAKRPQQQSKVLDAAN